MCLLCYKVRNFSNKLEREGAICVGVGRCGVWVGGWGCAWGLIQLYMCSLLFHARDFC